LKNKGEKGERWLFTATPPAQKHFPQRVWGILQSCFDQITSKLMKKAGKSGAKKYSTAGRSRHPRNR